MTESKTSPARPCQVSLVARLLLGTALGAVSIPAAAQDIPEIDGINDVPGGFQTSPNSGGARITPQATLLPGDDTLNNNQYDRRYEIDVDGANRIIEFDSFDVSSNVIVDYVNNGAAPASGRWTAVNRIGGGSPSQIFGLIRANDVNVWLINPDGITFGSDGGFSGASLLVSTLSFSGNDAQLLTQLDNGTAAVPSATNVSFDRNGNALRRINVQNGASINSTTGNIVMMSERLTLRGAITADNGDVVLIGARDVTFGDIGSPLSFSITQGVRLNQNNSGLTVSGDVTGNSVVVAAGGTGNLTASILNIDSAATLTASAMNGTVVLATATADTSMTDTATITNGGSTEANIVVEGPGNGTPADAGETRTLVSEQGGITIISDHDVTLTDAAIEADGAIVITSANDLTANNSSVVTPDDITLVAGDDLATATSAFGSSATRADDVFVSAGDAFALGDVTADSLESTGTPGTLTVGSATLGAIDVTSLLDIDATGNLGFTSLTSTSGIDVTVTGANIVGGGEVTANSTVSLAANAITVGAVSGGLAVDIDATNAISFASVASDGDIEVASATGSISGGDVNPGNAAPTGAAYFSVGGNDDITLGNVNATILGSSVGNPLIADNITVGDVTTAGGIDMVARDGNLEAGTLRTDGVNIELTATGEIDLAAAFTALGMGDPTAGNIGIYAGGDIGSTTSPQTLSAGLDVAVRSVSGDVTVGDVFAGDDIVLMARLNGGGTAGFDSVTFLIPSTADSDHATFVVPASDFAGTGITDPGAPGTASSVAFVAEPIANPLAIPPNPGARIFTGQVMGSDTFIQLDGGQRLAVAGQNQNIGDLNNVSGDVVVNATNAVLANNLDINGNLIVTGETVTLGANNQTRNQQVTGFVDIDATNGDITFRGDLTLRSNSDGFGTEGLDLTATGDIGPNANGNITLIGGTGADPSAITVELGGDFATNTILGQSLSLTDGTNAFTQGDITIGSVTTAQALALNSSDGNIEIDQASVTDANVGISISTGGSGNVTSTTSILTNGGDISISAGGNADLAQVSTSSADPLNPVVGNVNITAGDDVILNNGLFAGGDVTITATNLSGPALTGDGEDGLIIRDLTTGSADLDAASGDIRIGDLETTAGNLTVDATAGSVTGLASGWTALSGGSIIDAIGTATLAITGTAEIGQLDAATVTGSGIDSLTIRELNVTNATLSAVNRLHIDSGSATTADLDTTGGAAAGSVVGYDSANLTSSDQLAVFAGDTALLDTVTASGAGTPLTVTGGTVDVLNASTNTAIGNIAINATSGTLTVGTANATGAITLDKDGTAGSIVTNGDVTAAGDLTLDSESDITASGALSSTAGNIAITSTGDTSLFSAQAANGSFTATTTANGSTGAEGDFTASLVQAQGNVSVNADGAITATDDPASLAIPGFTQSIESTAGAVNLISGDETAVFSGAANGLFSVDAVSIDIGQISAASIDLDASTGAIALDDADASGNILIDKLGATDDVQLGDIDSTSGSILVNSSTSATLVDGNAVTGDIAVTATDGDVTVATATTPGANGDVVLTASGNVNAGTVSGGGDIIADAGVDAIVSSANFGGDFVAIAGADAIISSATLGGDVDVDALDDIAIGSVSGTRVTLDAADNVSGLSDPGATGLVPDFGRGNATATQDIAVNAGGNVQLGTLNAGASVSASGAGVDVQSAIAGTFIDIDAATGLLALGSGDAGTSITLDKLGAGAMLTATTLEADGDITATSSTTLDITSAASTNGSVTATAAGDASLGTGTAVTGTVALTSTGGTATGGALTGDTVIVSGVEVALTTVDAGTGGFSATANGDNLLVDTAMSDSDIELIKTGDVNGEDDGITANSLTADNDIIVSSETSVNLGTSSAGNLLSIVSPDTIEADDLQSDGSIAINTGGDAVLGDITSGRTIILLAAGDIGADSLSAVEDIAALAGGAINVTGFDAGDNVWLTAGTSLDLGGGSTSGSGADDATYVLDLALAGDTAQAANAITEGPMDAPDGDITIAAPDDFALSGAVNAAAGDATITVRNLDGGSDTTSVGASGGFEISDAELNLLNADNVVIDAGSQNIALGTFAIDGDTGSDTLRIVTSGNIDLSGEISGAGTGILQIGQGEIDAAGLVDPATLTSRINADTATASIDFANGIVDLRGVRIVFGNAAFNTLTDGISLSAGAELLSDAGSQLYIGDNTQRVFMQADRLRVAYSDFALFQNTAFSQGGGAILNADANNSISDVALELFSQGDGGEDSFAIFGEINGFIGRTAGVLPNSVLNIGTLNPRELRVTQSQSRANGCVIGSPDRGCLIVDLPPPEITTIDERQAQQLISTDDPSAFLNPLVGRGNEGLILDIAQVPVGIDMLDECGPDDASCQTTEPQE